MSGKDGGLARDKTLLDEFAGMALQGILSDPESSGTREQISRIAYEYATAMLKEKQRLEREGK